MPQNKPKAPESVVPLQAKTRFARIPYRAADADLPGKAWRLLTAIGRRVDAAGHSFIGRERLAREIGIHTRHLGRYLDKLREEGHLRQEEDGSFTLLFDEPDRPSFGPKGVPNPGPNQRDPGLDRPNPGPKQPNFGSRASIEEHPNEHPYEQPFEHLSAREGAITIDQDGNEVPAEELPEVVDAFECFWAASPHRPDDPKALAHREWDDLICQGINPEVIIAAAERRATTIEGPKYVKHAHKWLRLREFEEQEEAPTWGYSKLLWSVARAATKVIRRPREAEPRHSQHQHQCDSHTAAADEPAAVARGNRAAQLADRLGDPGDVLRRRLREEIFIGWFCDVEVLQLDADAGFLILGVPSERVAKELDWYLTDISAAWNVSRIEFRVPAQRE